MSGKEEIAKKGYMESKYVSGQGKAHACCRPHKEVFKCKMFGTFNIKLKSGRIDEFQPSIVTKKANYYFLTIRSGKHNYYGWAIRDHTSRQGTATLEVITKKLLPSALKEGSFAVIIHEQWNEAQIKAWASTQYWFQTFPFTPTSKADSEMLWKIIDVVPWEGMTVLDIGAHYGYFSFKAAEKGAQVTGVEPNTESLRCSHEIRDHILQHDINFLKYDNGKNHDITLYLSVHHQIDPTYENLKKTIEELKKRTRKHLFVELILPPMFPNDKSMNADEVDAIVEMTPIYTYKHNIRGVRRVYMWSNDE